MGSKSVALLLSLNFLFFSMISSSSGYKPPPHPAPVPSPPPNSTSPPPPPPVVSPPPPRCPNLRICLNILSPQVGPNSCCTLIAGLTDLEAAVCLCAQIRAQVIGIPININLFLNLLLNSCGKSPPPNYRCN